MDNLQCRIEVNDKSILLIIHLFELCSADSSDVQFYHVILLTLC